MNEEAPARGEDSLHGPVTATPELALVAEQLWPTCASPDYRVVDHVGTHADWITVEQQRVIGRRGRIDVILPARRSAAARALAAYSRLRAIRPRLTRLALAGGVLLGLVPERNVVLEARKDIASDTVTVLRELAQTLGSDIGAAMHVRRSANRKALLHVVNRRGDTLGYAKLARNDVSSAGIRNEIQALSELGGGTDVVRVPRVLTAGTLGDFPYLVTEPLPPRIRAVTPALGDAPSIAEFAALSPVVRSGLPRSTEHLARMHSRTDRLRQVAEVEPLLGVLDTLLGHATQSELVMPIARWSHGDFAFWNVGRTPQGQLWCWDFENVERDALAGLDVLHWHASRRRERSGVEGVGDRAGILSDSLPTLRAFGVASPEKLAILYRTYIAEIVLRTLETAADDGWSRTWVSRTELIRLAEHTAGGGAV